ncbi:MAG: drug/metabolite exporter YedA, partial [Gemmatimonadota bacterium]
MSEAPRGRVLAAYAAVYLVWGSTYLAIHFAIETLPPFLMAGVRFVVAGTILYGVLRVRGAPAPTRAQWQGAAVVGVLLLLGGNGSVVWAQQRVPSGIAALLVAMVPLWMVLIDWARPGGIRPRASVLAGLVLGTLGMLLLVGPENLAGSGRVDPVGAAVLVTGSLFWAAGSIYSRSARLAPPFVATAQQLLAGGAALLLFGVLAGEPAALDLAAISTRSLLALVYLIVFGALVGYTCYIWLLRVSPPAHVATYAYVNPVVALLLGWLLAGEALTARSVTAALVIVAGVAVVVLRRRRPPLER